MKCYLLIHCKFWINYSSGNYYFPLNISMIEFIIKSLKNKTSITYNIEENQSWMDEQKDIAERKEPNIIQE